MCVYGEISYEYVHHHVYMAERSLRTQIQTLRRRQKSPNFLGQIQANSPYSRQFCLRRSSGGKNHLIFQVKFKQILHILATISPFDAALSAGGKNHLIFQAKFKQILHILATIFASVRFRFQFRFCCGIDLRNILTTGSPHRNRNRNGTEAA